ncbi:MAG: ATP synthase F1 subunit delta [Clostridia bacterium]|nr:ATP synthase F1 subunit delta [Clostridia bacterium]
MTAFAKEYGEALYGLCAEENISAEVLEQLHTLKGCFHDQPDFVRLLSNMSMSREERVAICDKTLRGQVHPYVLNFLKILCERGALCEFAGCEAAFRARYNKDHNVVAASVTTAEPMRESQRTALVAKLRAMTGAEIELTEHVDAAVMGGIVLEMNGRRYDNSVRQRLESIRREMAGQV